MGGNNDQTAAAAARSATTTAAQSVTKSRRRRQKRNLMMRVGAGKELGDSRLLSSPRHDTSGHDLVWEIKESLKTSSRLREYYGDFLLISILDKCVDELEPVTFAYDARLNFFSQQLKVVKTKFPEVWLEEISTISTALSNLLREIHPLNKLCQHMIDDKAIGIDSTMYVEDTQDHVEQAASEIRRLIELCKRLVDDFSVFGEAQQNETLYILTMVTTIFIPAQFFTGVYGMNFVKPDGTPGIPELEWTYGYAYFWTLCITLTLTVWVLFKWKKLL